MSTKRDWLQHRAAPQPSQQGYETSPKPSYETRTKQLVYGTHCRLEVQGEIFEGVQGNAYFTGDGGNNFV